MRQNGKLTAGFLVLITWFALSLPASGARARLGQANDASLGDRPYADVTYTLKDAAIEVTIEAAPGYVLKGGEGVSFAFNVEGPADGLTITGLPKGTVVSTDAEPVEGAGKFHVRVRQLGGPAGGQFRSLRFKVIRSGGFTSEKQLFRTSRTTAGPSRFVVQLFDANGDPVRSGLVGDGALGDELAVTLNPEDQAACAGGTVTFSAAATGARRIRWQVSSNHGETWRFIPRATAPTLTLAAAAALDGNLYRAQFFGSRGPVTTTSATLKVNSAPTLVAAPESYSAIAGQTASFSASAEGKPSPNLQWQFSDDEGATFTLVPGATSSPLRFSAAASQHNHQYRAVFSNGCGTVTSSPGRLTVHTPALITTQPLSRTVCSAGDTLFVAAATGNPAPTVQWQVSSDAGQSFVNVPGAVSNTLRFVAGAMDTGNLYRAVFTNAAGSTATAPATLTVNVAPTINTQPADQTVNLGEMATFASSAIGSPVLMSQWQVSRDGGRSYTNLRSANSPTFSFPASREQQNNRYRVVYSNSCGGDTSVATRLTVNVPPAITSQAADRTVCRGTTVTFSAYADGRPVPKIQWQVSKDGGQTFSTISGPTAPTFSFVANTPQSGHLYRAVFSNPGGTVTSRAARLTVNAAPGVTGNPLDLVLVEGATARFALNLTGTPTPLVQWQVSVDGGASFNDIPGATSATLEFPAERSQNGQEYRAVLSNDCGILVTAAAKLSVGPMLMLANYFSNARTGLGDGTVRIVHPGEVDTDLCALIYVFDHNQQLLECCGCRVTPNGVLKLSVDSDLTQNPLTGVPLSGGAIKIVANSVNGLGGTCNPGRIDSPQPPLRAWASHVQNSGAMTETAFDIPVLSSGILRRLQNRCSAIRANASGLGICSCGD